MKTTMTKKQLLAYSLENLTILKYEMRKLAALRDSQNLPMKSSKIRATLIMGGVHFHAEMTGTDELETFIRTNGLGLYLAAQVCTSFSEYNQSWDIFFLSPTGE